MQHRIPPSQPATLDHRRRLAGRWWLVAAALATLLAACGGGSDGGGAAGTATTTAAPTPAPASFLVGGTVSGLTAPGLELQNGSERLAIPAQATSFQFTQSVAAGGRYAVTVVTAPAGLTCVVARGTGDDLQATVTNIDISCAPSMHVVSGTITGLSTAGLLLRNNGSDDLAVPALSQSFQFATRVAHGGSYDVQVASQPSGLTCTVSRGAGSGLATTVNDIAIACSARTYRIGGTVAGLTADGLVLQLNGGDDLVVPSQATGLEFATRIAHGSSYQVSVATQPAGLTCSVGNAAGNDVATDVTTVQVNCSTRTYSLGGTVTGLIGAGLTLQNNGGDPTSIAPGATQFAFATRIAHGASYAVTVQTPPVGQQCTVAGGTGAALQEPSGLTVSCSNIVLRTITATSGVGGSLSPAGAVTVNDGGSVSFTATPATHYAIDRWLVDGSPVQSGGSVFTLANVTADHVVQATFATATLSLSTAQLALSVFDMARDPSLTGESRQIVVTNTGSLAVTGLAIVYPTFPAGTGATSSCGASLAAGASCAVTITPDTIETSSCGAGTAPTPATVSFTASNAAAASADVVVLTYGCLWQGGMVFDLDDSTPQTGNVGGKVARVADQSVRRWGTLGLFVGASSSSDGLANTLAIVAANASSIGEAAGLCSNLTAEGYSDWFLPARDELVTVAGRLHAASLLPNGNFWSSTEANASQAIYINTATQVVTLGTKSVSVRTRCIRMLN